MADPQILVSFPGITPNRVLSATMTLSHGIAPSACLLEIVPTLLLTANPGTLRIEYGTSVLEFHDARINLVTTHFGPGGQVMTVQIQDRRWKWDFGAIDLRANIRTDKDGLVIKDGTELSPREIATKLFEAMGETGFDVDDLPDETRPEASWVAENPAAELERLCASLGCRVVLHLDGTVRIHKLGIGAFLPDLPLFEITSIVGADVPKKPDQVVIVTGAARYQARLALEAVGKDTDGSLKPIDDLSYTPTGGWEKSDFDSGFWDIEEQFDCHAQRLAQECVYRWYRAAMPPDDELPTFLKDDAGKALDRELLLPLSDTLLETEKTPEGEKIPKRAKILGVKWSDTLDFANNDDECEMSDVDFSLDEELGIVKFSQPVIKLSADESLENEEAFARLECSFRIRDAIDLPFNRFQKYRATPGPKLNTGALVIRRDEMIAKTIAVYDADGNLIDEISNRHKLADEADKELDAIMQQFNLGPTAEKIYAGLVPVDPDGAVQQVSWTVGPGGVVTTASRNTEHNFSLPSYKERQRIKLQQAASEVQKAEKITQGKTK